MGLVCYIFLVPLYSRIFNLTFEAPAVLGGLFNAAPFYFGDCQLLIVESNLVNNLGFSLIMHLLILLLEAFCFTASHILYNNMGSKRVLSGVLLKTPFIHFTIPYIVRLTLLDSLPFFKYCAGRSIPFPLLLG